MICEKCGAQLRKGAKFCDECGEKVVLKEVVEKTIDTNTTEHHDIDYDYNEKAYQNIKDDVVTNNQNIEEPKEQKGIISFIQKKKPLLIGGVIGLVILLLIVIVSVSSGSSSVGSNSGSDNDYVGSGQETNSSYPDIQWITDRRVQFNSEDKQYVVFFGLQDSGKNYVSASGIASIKITDETGNELFNKDISFTEKDFTEWTNQSWDSPRFMCGIYINQSDIAGSASTSGSLSLAVKCDTAEFEPDNLYIYDLPSKELSVQLPITPAKVTNYNYRGDVETIVSITKISCESRTNYDSTATLTINMNVELIANYSDITGHSSKVGYKLKNSEGIIVDSGQFYISPMEVGEIVAEQGMIYNIDPNDTYTLTFENTK